MVDIANSWLRDAAKDLPWAQSCEDAWIGKAIADMSREERQVFQPLYYVCKNLAPGVGPAVLIWHGDADITVPWTQSQALLDTIVSARGGSEGLCFELIENAGHASERMYTDERLEKLRTWLEETVYG